MEVLLAILLVLAIFVGVPAGMGFGIVGILAWRERSLAPQRTQRELTCTVDADCPAGYICMNGRCVPGTRS